MQNSARFLDEENRIIGGASAPSAIPWQVSIRKYGSHFCGGTILDSKTILSAAHCFSKGASTNGYTILAGTRDRTSNNGQVCTICFLNGFTFLGILFFTL